MLNNIEKPLTPLALPLNLCLCKLQVDPDFINACDALRKNAGDNEVLEYENFLTVYVPMKRNLLRAFDATLNVCHVMCCEVM
jgi:hypothetical protein